MPVDVFAKKEEDGQGIDFDHPDYLMTDQLLHVQKGFANDIAASFSKRLACLCKHTFEFETIFQEYLLPARDENANDCSEYS